MLTKPEAGWTDFCLYGTCHYPLSYISNIAYDWLEQAIHGLETLQPFCVKAFMEPGTFLCVVSGYYCYMITESMFGDPQDMEDVVTDCVRISMVDFCRELVQDIEADVIGWASFQDYSEEPDMQKVVELEELLGRLSELVEMRQNCFRGWVRVADLQKDTDSNLTEPIPEFNNPIAPRRNRRHNPSRNKWSRRFRQ